MGTISCQRTLTKSIRLSYLPRAERYRQFVDVLQQEIVPGETLHPRGQWTVGVRVRGVKSFFVVFLRFELDEAKQGRQARNLTKSHTKNSSSNQHKNKKSLFFPVPKDP